jgi:hypothetical protein
LDRAAILLNQLREKLNTWIPSIQRATGSTVVQSEQPGGEFILAVLWNKNGVESRYEKAFTKAFVFRASMHRPQLEWHVEKRACDYARDIMREVLAQRGAL